ncbi:MAG: amidase [Alphaproteobacteria bacterium]|nr:amidase [Alphaproteobacteria bacterium]
MSAETRLTHLGLIETAEGIASGRFSSEEVTRACIDRIEAAQPHLNCFIRLEAEEALDAARAADAKKARGEALGPLHGVPLAHKDMFYRAGKPATGGNAIQRDFVPDYTATVIERLGAAGALCLGGLNMSEFASGPVGQNLHYGDCRNPWNTAHAPGGSSSGPGSAVAGRLVHGALGSDTGGSVRIPAALCGLVGLKGTQGRVSRYGGMPLSFSLDCFGPLARTVDDCARLYQVIAGADPMDPTASLEPVGDYEGAPKKPVKSLRIGIDHRHGGIAPSGEVVDAIKAALGIYGDLGVEIVEVTMPDQDELNALSNVITRSEAATLHRKWLRTRRDDYSPQVRRRIEIGLALPATRYIEALSLRSHHLQRLMDAVFTKCDALILPSVGEPSPTLAELDVGDSDALPAMLMRLTGYTRPVNYYGVPALTVPAGFAGNGLPLGFQLVGRPFDEALLFQLAGAYQAVTEHHLKAPTIEGIG